MAEDDRCYRHQFDEAEAMCRHCAQNYCSECLVYSFGPKKPPFCISCALGAAGVRSSAAKSPRLSRREQRRVHKDAKQAAKVKAEADAEPVVADAGSMSIDWPNDDGRIAS